MNPQPKDKTLIIIGAGVAGLAAGIYAQMNGYRSRIFELHSLPGGLCTAWERKGYTFDGCIHYLFGTGEGQPFNRLWQELGALEGRKIVDHDEYIRVTDGEKALVAFADPARLETHLLDLSPADEKLIRAFTHGIRQFERFDLSVLVDQPKALMTPDDYRRVGTRMLPFVPPLFKWGFRSVGELARQFKDPFLRRALPQLFSWEEAPVMMGMMLLASMQSHNAGFTIGGSLEFARGLEKRYLELGGEITYRGQVEKILTQDGRAVAVRLYNDEVHTADYILSAADGHATIFDLLDGRYLNRRIRSMYDGHLAIHSQVQVSLGIKRDLSSEPHWVTHLLDEPVLIAGEPRNEVSVKHYCFDPSLAPAGKSVIEIMMRTNYAYWEHIYGRGPYDSEQTEVSDILIGLLEKWYPGIRKDIEFVDEATPLSYERYTGNWLGSTCGFLLTDETMIMMVRGVPPTLPGLENFYMAGQWVEPGGSLPLAAASARNAIQLICHADKKPFRTETK